MATVIRPAEEVTRASGLARPFAYLRGIPFILTGDEDYPEGINQYIHERVRGKLTSRHDGQERLKLRALEYGSARALAYNLCDVLNWAENGQAHPFVGALGWTEIKEWHITDLYQEALREGFWSQEFFKTGHPSGLSPDSIRTRVSQALGCYAWLDRNGFVKNFNYVPAIQVISKAKDDTLLAFRREMRRIETNVVPVTAPRIRRAPGDTPLPSPEHLADFFEAIPNVPHRLAGMLMFETGMRAEEIVENTLIPGVLHSRKADSKRIWYQLSEWPDEAYRLEWNLQDDLYIGVLPTREAAWFQEARRGYQCDMRILGKGRKIRKVGVPPALLRRIWTYIDSRERGDRLAERRARGKGDTAHVFLNRFGDQLSYHAIWEAFEAANTILRKQGVPIEITPHGLRRAFACHFLEAHILSKAQEAGYERTAIPAEFMRAVGSDLLLVVKQELGHSEFKTTQVYLEQLVSGRIRFAALQTWNRYLDGFLGDEMPEENDAVAPGSPDVARGL